MHSPAVAPQAEAREKLPGKLDSHHHLWAYEPVEFGWIDDAMAMLRRDFCADDLVGAMDEAGVASAVAVQARQSLAETDWLLAQAAAQPRIVGVVGWAPIANPALPAMLEAFAEQPCLVGLRHVVQGEPAGFLDGEAFNRGIALLDAAGLAYDLLVREWQLEEAMRFVDRHPNQRFVLDHCAKPAIKAQSLQQWSKHLRQLALRPNVFCKLSGLATEANWSSWQLDDLRPYLDVVLEAFGTHRVMAGSDWPVCLTATSYSRWWRELERYTAALSGDEHDAIFGGVARSFYAINPPSEAA